MEAMKSDKSKQETVLHLLQLPFKNISQAQMRQDHGQQVEAVKELDISSKFYFQNLTTHQLRLFDYVTEMIDNINDYNGSLKGLGQSKGDSDGTDLTKDSIKDKVEKEDKEEKVDN